MRSATIKRCSWVSVDDPLMLQYHDREWGVPVHDDRKHFEFLVLEGAQAGLSWTIVLKKRSYRLDHLFLVVQKIGDSLQERLQRDALLEQLPISETDLGLRSSRHSSVLLFLRCLVSLSLQSFDIVWCGLEEQFLQGPPVVQTTAHLGD
jgi:hypothetical protein